VKKQDIYGNQAKIVYLAIGSNLGNRRHNIENAKYLINDKDTKIIKISKIYETQSWPNKKFPKYLNLVLKIKTRLTPLTLLKKIKHIEYLLGRTKSLKNFPRTCDIDILDYNNKIIIIKSSKKNLILPHPEVHKRGFVLLPLFDVCRNWIHPQKNIDISALLKALNINRINSIKEL